ncbi:MAG: hypothetical protein QNJ61_02405 [Desulfobacterales bacterium]|nr:hypothetical protein [Desulfobacterales bacterium]
MMKTETDVLLEEYKQLFAFMNSYALATFRVPPVVVTIASALAIYSKELPPLFGLGVSLGVFVMLLWVGCCHAMLSGIGLKLVEIEQKINRNINASAPESGLSYHMDYLGQGIQKLPGFL